MSLAEDIRWKQRFNNYRKALTQLKKFAAKGQLSDLEQQGLIKAFEYTYELGWNTLKDYLEYQGTTDMSGSRDVIRESYRANLIADGDTWMDMLKSRNLTSHSYNEDTANEISEAILNQYVDTFNVLEQKLDGISQYKLDL